MRLLKVQSLDQSVETILQTMESLNLKRIENIPIDKALGKILAEDIIARENIPAFRRSTMDGYAVQSGSTNGATQTIPAILELVEEIEMGKQPRKKINASETSEIFTGGMLPEGADAVVPVENTEKIGGNFVSIYSPVTYLEHVVDIGEDTNQGEVYFRKGTIITPAVVAGTVSLGYLKVDAYAPLTARVLSTGDEILPPDSIIPPGMTRDVNSYSISSLCQDLGIKVIERKLLQDVKKIIRVELEKTDVDLIIISGSSSKGTKDFVPAIIEQEFNPGMLFHGIAIKPGKPTGFGTDGKKMILGLPGHPVSAVAVFLAVFAPAFRHYYGIQDSKKIPCSISQSMPATPGRTLIQLVSLEETVTGWVCHPIFGASGNLSTLAKADGYFVIDQHEEGVVKEQNVNVTLFSL